MQQISAVYTVVLLSINFIAINDLDYIFIDQMPSKDMAA